MVESRIVSWTGPANYASCPWRPQHSWGTVIPQAPFPFSLVASRGGGGAHQAFCSAQHALNVIAEACLNLLKKKKVSQGLLPPFWIVCITIFLFAGLIWPAVNMRLIKRHIDDRDGTGTATLLPEDPEDMVW
jgi:hypothetical protein